MRRRHAATVQITLSASQVAVNQASTLTWSSTNATSCTASGAWAGHQGPDRLTDGHERDCGDLHLQHQLLRHRRYRQRLGGCW